MLKRLDPQACKLECYRLDGRVTKLFARTVRRFPYLLEQMKLS